MNKRTFAFIILAVFVLAACQPAPTTILRPTLQPFPTMTVGQVVRGPLGTPGVRPDFNVLPNPATAVALANRPTATPNRRQCPAPAPDVDLGDFPTSREAAQIAINTYLNAGGDLEALQETIITGWEAFGNRGYFRTDVDLTGEGEGEVVIGYIAPGDVGTLLIYGCEAGRYVLRYESVADGVDPPRLIQLGDINNNPYGEMVFARRTCLSADLCEFQSQIITWDARSGQFVNLLDSIVTTLDLPELRDIDNDQVLELVLSLESNGTSATGPLRTGTNVYDWNGTNYRLSFVELDPPRYHIQIVHEADKFFSRLEMDAAIELYQLALDDDEDFGYWFNDGSVTVDSYALYRLLLAYAYSGQGLQIAETLTRIDEIFPLEEGSTEDDLPVYVRMARLLADTLTITNSLGTACAEVRAYIEEPENTNALTLLNRYGSRSPTYTALDLCPF